MSPVTVLQFHCETKYDQKLNRFCISSKIDENSKSCYRLSQIPFHNIITCANKKYLVVLQLSRFPGKGEKLLNYILSTLKVRNSRPDTFLSVIWHDMILYLDRNCKKKNQNPPILIVLNTSATKIKANVFIENGWFVDTSWLLSDVPVVDISPEERVLDLLSCLPWTGARARIVPRWDSGGAKVPRWDTGGIQVPRWDTGVLAWHWCHGLTPFVWWRHVCHRWQWISTKTNQNVLMIEAALRPGGLLRVHCPTMAGFGYRTIKVATDSTVVEVQKSS